MDYDMVGKMVVIDHLRQAITSPEKDPFGLRKTYARKALLVLYEEWDNYHGGPSIDCYVCGAREGIPGQLETSLCVCVTPTLKSYRDTQREALAEMAALDQEQGLF